MEKKYNYTYQIKNLINGKTYIGVHSTDDLNDGYMGSGYRLKQSMKKHGKENFVKTIMCFFDTAKEAYEEEEFLVDEKWVKRKDTYNMAIGGGIPPSHKGVKRSKETKQKIREYQLGTKKPWSSEWNKKNKVGNKNCVGRKYTEETIKKMSLSSNNVGNNNPMYGKEHSEQTKELIRQKTQFRKKDNLPMYITNRNKNKNTYQVTYKGKYVGVYPTIEEAVKGRDNYINNINNTL